MTDCLSIVSSTNRLVRRSKEKEEKRVQERRRNLLYLIGDFLQENGYTDTHETFAKEARLCGDIVVCDNIDLDSIILEYSDYYYTKFNKYPKICKKIDSTVPNCDICAEYLYKCEYYCPRDKREKATKNFRKQEEETNCTKVRSSSKEIENVSMFPNPSMRITSIFPLYDNTAADLSRNKSLNTDGDFRNEKSLKPIGDLYPSGSELREIADAISREILMATLNVHWNDIKGLSECKVQLKEATVYPIKYPTLFNSKLRPWKGILLYGPPGTGKTMLAKAVASESNATFFNITSSSLVSKWRGESEKYVRVLLDLAKYYAPSIIFIDEIDWTATGNDNSSTVKSEPSRRFRAELLARLDGLLSMEDANVLLLAATNIPWDLDAALLRRLEKRIHVDLPDTESRYEILAPYIDNDLLNTSEFKDILKNTEGYSGADLKLLCKEAWMMQLRPTWNLLEDLNLSLNEVNKPECIKEIYYLFSAMKNITPTVKQLSEKYKIWKEGM